MRVLVASDGNLPPESAAEIASRLAGDDGAVRVVTAIEVPRSVLDSLRTAYEEIHPAPPVDTDAEYVTAGTMPARISPAWPGDDAFIGRYVQDQTAQRLEEIHSALEAVGTTAEVTGIESEDPTSTILDQIKAFGADVLVIGSHGQGRFEGMLGSVGTKLVRRSPVSVIVCKE